MTIAQRDAASSKDLIRSVSSLSNNLMSEVAKVIIGKPENIRKVTVGVLSNGNVLIEDNPGLAKTLMANTFASSLGCKFKRVQFTPDLMPGDVLGTHILQQTDSGQREMLFEPGPVFTNILLADEINRASPKTQSAMLETMQERSVTLRGQTRELPDPFFVIASQNPIEMEGTYPLPEAQLDRFLFRLIIDYPDAASEAEIIRRKIGPSVELHPIVSKQAILEGKDMIHTGINAEKNVLEYISSIVQNTSNIPKVTLGASPRASVALLYASKGYAAVTEGRSYVIPDDVKAVAFDVLNHRLILQQNALLDLDDGDSNSATEYLRKLIKGCIDEVIVPV